jgi:hypothetical protein
MKRNRAGWAQRLLAFLGLRRPPRQPFAELDDQPPDIGVREPRRPRPESPGGAATLELPDTE